MARQWLTILADHVALDAAAAGGLFRFNHDLDPLQMLREGAAIDGPGLSA